MDRAVEPAAMRVLMVLDKPFRTDLRVEREIRALRSRGYELTLLCEGQADEPELSDWEGAEVRRLRPPSSRRARWAHYAMATLTGRSPVWEHALYELVSRRPFDVIHCHDLPVANSGIRVARRIGARTVFDRHENWPGLLQGLRSDFPPGLRRQVLWSTINNPTVWRHWEKKAVRAADLVIAVSHEAAQELPTPPRDLAVVSNYVDLNALPEPSEMPPIDRDRPLRVCFVGVFNPMFALAETVRAVALLPPAAATLVLVGDGDDRPRLERVVRELRLESQVRLLGWRPRLEALAEIRDAHVCILPLRDNDLTRTTVGNKLFEYMGLERPVLSSGIGVMARIISDAGAGEVVDPWTPEAVAAAFERLRGQPDRLAKMGRAGRTAVLTRYNWDREREALLLAYTRLLKK